MLFERNTNNDFQAINNYFSHPGRLAKNVQNQYGFAIGGPVWIPKIVHGKNKLFWFMDYEGTKQVQYASDVNLTLPTAAMRTGDFSAAPTVIYDPLTGNPDGTGRTAFPGNIIPSNRIASRVGHAHGSSAGADQAELVPNQLRRLRHHHRTA